LKITTSVEDKRGCGYRKPGGLYLMGGYPADSCHRLPLELHVCPTCSQGIKPARGWTWVDAVKIFLPACGFDTYANPNSMHCLHCVVCNPSLLVPQKEFADGPPEHFGMSGLIWVGEKFYPTPETFVDEANTMGVSRRIKAIPNGFVLGETWVFFAHRYAIEDEDNPAIEKRHPGIFEAFMPTSIDYVVKGDETDDDLERMEQRGISLVKVVHKNINENIPLPAADVPLNKILKSGLANKLAFEGDYTMRSDLIDMSVNDLTKIKGIGRKTAEDIIEAIK